MASLELEAAILETGSDAGHASGPRSGLGVGPCAFSWSGVRISHAFAVLLVLSGRRGTLSHDRGASYTSLVADAIVGAMQRFYMRYMLVALPRSRKTCQRSQN